MHVLILSAAFWNFTHAWTGQSNCCRIRQLTGVCVRVRETDHLEEGDWRTNFISLLNHSDPSLLLLSSCHSTSRYRRPRWSRWLLGSTWRLCTPPSTLMKVLWGRGCHVLSFKMTVARMRKKVFQPRVTAKPRHTIIWDRSQPVGKPAWKPNNAPVTTLYYLYTSLSRL